MFHIFFKSRTVNISLLICSGSLNLSSSSHPEVHNDEGLLAFTVKRKSLTLSPPPLIVTLFVLDYIFRLIHFFGEFL